MNRPWAQHGGQENIIQNFGGKRKAPTSKTTHKWGNTIYMYLVKWTDLSHEKGKWWPLVHILTNVRVP
jgi:hypothetical protein